MNWVYSLFCLLCNFSMKMNLIPAYWREKRFKQKLSRQRCRKIFEKIIIKRSRIVSNVYISLLIQFKNSTLHHVITNAPQYLGSHVFETSGILMVFRDLLRNRTIFFSHSPEFFVYSGLTSFRRAYMPPCLISKTSGRILIKFDADGRHQHLRFHNWFLFVSLLYIQFHR